MIKLLVLYCKKSIWFKNYNLLRVIIKMATKKNRLDIIFDR